MPLKPYLEQIDFIEKNKLDTPVTFFDERNLQDALDTIKEVYGDDILIFYALKSCYNKSILEALLNTGVGVEVLSEFEYNLAVATGFKSIVLNGMGRSHELLSRVTADNNIIIIDTTNDLKNLSQIAKSSGNKIRVGFGLRLDLSNLDENNSYISEEHPLGNDINSELVSKFMEFCQTHNNVNWEMLHIHITINETSPQIYKEAISQISTVLQHIATRTNLLPKIINIGGGYEVYDPGLKPEFVKLFEEIKQAFRKHLGGYKIAIEPGRYLSAYAGYAIGKVLDIKQIAQKYWIVTDIGTNTLIPNPNARYKLAEPITNHSSGMFRIGITDGITSPANNIVFETRIDKLPDIGSYICIENTGAYTDVYSTFWAYPPYITCSVDNDGKMRVYRSEEDIEQLQSIIFK